MAKGMNIRKDDTVDRDRRQGQGQDRPRAAHRARQAPRLRRGPEHRQAPHPAALGQGHAEGAVEWHHRPGGSDRRLQRDAPRPHRQQADPGRRARRRRRQAPALCQAHRQGDRAKRSRTDGSSDNPRCKAGGAATAAARDLRERGRRQADRRSSATRAGCRSRGLVKITVNMGVGDAKQSTPILEAATEQLATITGQHPSIRRARQLDRQLQAPRGDARRRRRDPARRPHVGVPRSPDHDLDPADPRLPRPQAALLRRPRQLLDRRSRAADLPRDRLRLDRRGPRSRHRDHDHRGHRRGGLSSCSSGSGCRSRRSIAPAWSSPRSTRRRSAATRRPGCGPRPSRLRSSSSRKRTPRPTLSPSATKRAKRARTGAEGDGGGDQETSSDESSEELTRNGEDVTKGAPAARRQVQDPRVQPLPQLRAVARLLP